MPLLYTWRAEQVRTGKLWFSGSGHKHADQNLEIVRLERELRAKLLSNGACWCTS